MREKTLEEKHLEAEFYAKKFYLSYSGLNKLLDSPTFFYKHYILGQQENLKFPGIIMGKAIHCLLLDREMFENQFLVASSNIPTANTLTVIERVFEYHCKIVAEQQIEMTDNDLVFYSNHVLDVLKDINLHQSLKTDSQRLEKIINEQSKDYFEYLKNAQGKDIIDVETYDKCILAVESIKNNEAISVLLGLTNNKENVVLNEHPLQIEPGNFPSIQFGLKGILDNLNIDKETKTIYINDIKRTGKSLIYFTESIEKYNYWAQAAMYVNLVEANLVELLGTVINNDWKIVFNFIVIDQFNQTYAFEVSNATMHKWKVDLLQKLYEAEYHYTNNNYSLPYEYATGKVIL